MLVIIAVAAVALLAAPTEEVPDSLRRVIEALSSLECHIGCWSQRWLTPFTLGRRITCQPE
ncbi:MAG TPA: hypothetical protein VMX56_03160, partial [Anaerolineales bacterium]|nr:hypothetical protein [Anaerolineales bacterium]